ncbi:MAG: TolC family protein [Bacteroidales bacterium]|nr:TolC family protein [Bacteroidales bacterium]MBD5190706.1 TolC family protein [Bacteroidales bacterium]MBD5209636.1 TolC family protein [Bacteroidales bacterium]
MKKLYSLALCLVAFGAAAQSVSLDSCRNMALKNNKLVKIAEENIRGAGYTRKAATAAYLPGIDFTGGYMYNQHQIELLGEDAKLPTMSFDMETGKYNYNAVVGPNGVPVMDPSSGLPVPSTIALIPKEAMSFDTHNVFAGAFTLTQPIFMGGQIRALNQIAKYGESLAKSMHNQVSQEVIYKVDEAYWLVVSLKEKKNLAENLVKLVDSLRDNVKAMLDEGVATQSDYLTVEVKYNEACIALTKVDNGLSLSRMALAQICGLPVDTQMELEDESLSHTAGTPSGMMVTDMQDVYASRPDLDVLRQGIKIFESKEKLALGAMLPKIAAVGAYSFSNPNVIHGFEKKFGGGFSVGATLTIPLWHWGGNYNQYRAAKSNTAAQKLLLEDMEEKVDLQVSQAKYSFQEAHKTYDMTVNNMKSADANLKNAEIGFKEGVLTADDVIAAQTAWVKANSEKIDAEIGIRLCEVYLSKVTGTMKY